MLTSCVTDSTASPVQDRSVNAV